MNHTVVLSDEAYRFVCDQLSDASEDFHYRADKHDEYEESDVIEFDRKQAEVDAALANPIDVDLVDALSWLGTICEQWDDDEMLSDRGRMEIGALLMRAFKLDEYPLYDGNDDATQRYFSSDIAARARLNEITS